MNAQEKTDLIKLLNTELKNFDISQRAIRVTRESEIFTVGQLVQHKKEDLLKYKNLKSKVMEELEILVNSKDLTFNYKIDNMKTPEEILAEVQPIAEAVFGRNGKVTVSPFFDKYFFCIGFESPEWNSISVFDIEKFYNRTSHLIDYSFEWNFCFIESNLDFQIVISFEVQNPAKVSENG